QELFSWLDTSKVRIGTNGPRLAQQGNLCLCYCPTNFRPLPFLPIPQRIGLVPLSGFMLGGGFGSLRKAIDDESRQGTLPISCPRRESDCGHSRSGRALRRLPNVLSPNVARKRFRAHPGGFGLHAGLQRRALRPPGDR